MRISSRRLLCLATVLPLMLLAPASAMAAEPPATDPSQDPAVREAIALLDLWIAEQVEYGEIPGLAIAVVQGDRLVWAKGYGVADLSAGTPMTPETPLRVGSVSKMFTATAVLQLRDAGKLRLSDPVVRHLPWFKVKTAFAPAGPITVENLITHTSGLPREGAFPYWTTHVFPSREQLQAALPEQSAVFPPGERIKYSNLGVALAGELVASTSGESWGEYVNRRLIEPLGMKSSSAAPSPELVSRLARAYQRKPAGGSRALMEYYDTGAIAPAAAVVSTALDLAKFASFHLGAGGPSAEGVLAAATRKDMQRLRYIDSGWKSGRGLGFLIARREDRTLVSHGGWIGGHRADLLLDPARNIGVVALTNADDAAPGMFTRKALDELGEVLASAGKKPQPKIEPDPAWRTFLGTYTDPWGWEYQVIELGGGLALYEHSYPPEDDPADSLTRLEPLGGRVFRQSDGETLEFEIDAAGKVQRLRRRSEYLMPKAPPARPGG